MNMIDDRVALKEKPEDTRYMKRLHWECGETKHNELDSQFFAIIGNCRLGNVKVHNSLMGPGRR